MEQFVILIIIAAISLINWLLQKSAEHKNRRMAQQKEAEGGGAGDADADEQTARSDEGKWAAPEEDLRKFMEALGLPGEDLPPPPVVQKHQPPPIPEIITPPQAPPAVAKTNAQIRAQASKEMRELAARFQQQAYDIAEPDTGGSSTTNDFREFLQSPKKLRNGIILREILGPPKGLENF